MVCKLVTAASATLIALPLLSAAAPVVEKRAGITCQKKFAGHLYAYTLSGQPQQNLTVTFDSESFLKVDYTAKAQPVYTQFVSLVLLITEFSGVTDDSCPRMNAGRKAGTRTATCMAS